MIELTPKEMNIVTGLATQHLSEGTEIWVFGSRIDGTCHDTSDLDLVMHSDTRLDRQQAVAEFSSFKEALQNSNLPILVDLLLWQDLPEHFKNNILNKHEKLIFREAKQV